MVRKGWTDQSNQQVFVVEQLKETAGYAERMPGGVREGGREASPYSICNGVDQDHIETSVSRPGVSHPGEPCKVPDQDRPGRSTFGAHSLRHRVPDPVGTKVLARSISVKTSNRGLLMLMVISFVTSRCTTEI